MYYFKKNTSYLNFAFNLAAFYFGGLILVTILCKIVLEYIFGMNVLPVGRFYTLAGGEPVVNHYHLYHAIRGALNIIVAVLILLHLKKRRDRVIAMTDQVSDVSNTKDNFLKSDLEDQEQKRNKRIQEETSF